MFTQPPGKKRSWDNNELQRSSIKKSRIEEEKTNCENNAKTEVTEDATYSIEDGGFQMAGFVSESHKFKNTSLNQNQIPFGAIRKDIFILRNSLPPGIWVKGFDDRMDLFSVMIRGPEETPYEDCLFVFDVQIPQSYPNNPPQFHYYSYGRTMNPNLYNSGKVCLSLLGTWPAQRPEEKWNDKSTLLQVVVSIQGLILVKEPYYNEPGRENIKQEEASRHYNEELAHESLLVMRYLQQQPHPHFKNEIKQHFAKTNSRILERYKKWLEESEGFKKKCKSNLTPSERRKRLTRRKIDNATAYLPMFPLLPISTEMCKKMRKTVQELAELWQA